MKNDNDKIKILSIGIFSLAAAYVFYFFSPSGFFPGINDTSYWYSYLFSRSAARSVNVVGVVVDDQSIHKIANRWPLSRAVYAELIQKLETEKVNTIGFDFVFEGASENPTDDIIFKQTLDSVSANKISRVILGLTLNEGKSADEKTKTVFTLLSKDFKESAYAAGMVNTPYDPDGKIRRLRGYVDIGPGERYYSLSVQLASSYLNRPPEEVVKKLPLRFDKTFLINYLLKPNDIIRVSLYDVLNNMAELKRTYGVSFLNNSLVLVYPEAEITHDSAHTPVGTMPGGLLHINGSVDIIAGRVFREVPFLGFAVEAGALAGIFYILRYCGLLTGFLFTFGIIFVNFWILLVCRLFGVTFDFSRVVAFAALFFTGGSLYKYLSFLTQLLRIKDKATRDPLRGIFTLRYFLYRLEFESKKIYFSQDLYLVFFKLNSFSENMETPSGGTAKSVWQKIQPFLDLKGSFWALYSHNELAGCVISRKNNITSCVRSLKNNLEMVFHQEQSHVSVSAVCVKLRREYSI
ncbi:MAG: CHASE2 domain-containing protein, partial [Candidatus Omnitrophica bacterium]|nr:CHASE2 domain-containing protein [Candidatus Omnitrophota bacterium]